MRCLVVAAALVAITLAADKPTTQSSFDLQVAFNLADANQDGTIQYLEFNGLYATFDDNADGLINATEFATHFTKTGMSPEGSVYIFYKMDDDENEVVDRSEVNSSFTTFDFNADGGVTYEEYTGVMMVILNELSIAQTVGEKLDVMYNAADVDQDGTLTAAEFFEILGNADTNADKNVTMEEFKQYWMRSTLEPVDRTEALFALLDMDNSGGIDEPDRIPILRTFDYNSNTMVSKSEFDYTMLWLLHKVIDNINAGSGAFGTDFKMMFDAVDTNGDAYLDPSEFEAVFMKGDNDMSGDINAGEYIKTFTSHGLTDKEALFAFFLNDMDDSNNLDKAEMRNQFNKFDKNGDGKIMFEEFKKTEMAYINLISKASAAGEKFSQLVDAADVDGDGLLSYDDAFKVVSSADMNGDGVHKAEFEKFMMSKTGVDKMISDGYFGAFDRDMNGMVGGDAEIKSVFSSFDYDKDGQLSKEEYLNAMIFVYAYTVKNSYAQKMKGFNVEEAFKRSDNNSDGFITVDEFSSLDGVNISDFIAYSMMSGMNRTESLYIFFRLDYNEDNLLVKAELVPAFNGMDSNDDGKVDLAEYKTSIDKTFEQVAEARQTGEKLDVLFHGADVDMDDTLTRTEMTSIFAAADENKDGLVSDTEFKKYWKAKTNEPDERTDLLFGYLDEDSDGFFGNDNEKTNLFDAFDYGDDDMVSHDEFNDAMLFLFAKAVGDLEMAAAAQQIIGYFF